MILEEAIRILTQSKACEFEGNVEELEEAHQLGIEALKTVRATRLVHYYTFIGLLPGESK